VGEAEGFSVIEARDGLAALQYAVEDQPAAIVIDEELARSNSQNQSALTAADVRKRLESEPSTQSIPVHIMTPNNPVGIVPQNPGAPRTFVPLMAQRRYAAVAEREAV